MHCFFFFFASLFPLYLSVGFKVVKMVVGDCGVLANEGVTRKREIASIWSVICAVQEKRFSPSFEVMI